jgi:hypothetical protein
VSNLTVVNSTTVTATFAISATASNTSRTVTVATGGGTSNGVTFTVAAPTLSAISPTSGNKGATVPVTLTGVGLTGATAIGGLGSNITVQNFTVVNDSTITASLVIGSGANGGARDVTVNPPGGTTNPVVFTVNGPTLASISPNSGIRGTSVNVTLAGTNLDGASSINVSGSGVSVSNFAAVNSTSVTATFTISSSAGFGGRNVAVVTPGGTTGNVTFTVQGAALSFTGPILPLTGGGTGTKSGVIFVANNGDLSVMLTGAPTISKASGAGNGTFSITGGTCGSGTVLSTPLGTCTVNVQYSGETNTSTATGQISIPVNSGVGLTSPQTFQFNAN